MAVVNLFIRRQIISAGTFPALGNATANHSDGADISGVFDKLLSRM